MTKVALGDQVPGFITRNELIAGSAHEWSTLGKRQVDEIFINYCLSKLTRENARTLIRNAAGVLKIGGHLRVADIDANHPHPRYQDMITTVRFRTDVSAIMEVMGECGFQTWPLEFHTADGEFHQRPINPEHGLVTRSRSIDARGRDPDLQLSSLVVDGVLAFAERASRYWMTSDDVREVYLGILDRPPDCEQAICLDIAQYDTTRLLGAHLLRTPEFHRTLAFPFAIPTLAQGDYDAVIRGIPVGQRKGRVGYYIGPLGDCTNVGFATDYAKLDGQVGSDIPPNAEYYSVLKSVLDSDGKNYVAVELGAGYGTWSIRAGLAAQLRTIPDIHLVAAEAAVGHYDFLGRHFTNNGFNPQDHTLVQCAIAGQDGHAYFPSLHNPAADWGARAIPEEKLTELGGADATDRLGQEYSPVPALSIATLIRPFPRIDLLHIDIQGHELDAVQASVADIDMKVQLMFIGTHSYQADSALIRLLGSHGWKALHIIPKNVWRDAAGRLVAGTDGEQVWVNRRSPQNGGERMRSITDVDGLRQRRRAWGDCAKSTSALSRPDGPSPVATNWDPLMPDDKPRFPWPIAILSFGRPDILKQVLMSLRTQSLGLDDGQVLLFQDGNRDRWTANALVPDETGESCVNIFRSIFPGGQVICSDTNLGIALNFDRAERTVFDRAGAAAFFEDDLVLSEHYLDALAKLMTFALNEERVGYVAAYGDHTASLEQQMAGSNKVVSMRHKWGFGLTKRQWERQMPVIEPYLKLLEGANYRLRDHNKIFAYFERFGYRISASSQDAAKDLAANVVGSTNLMSYVCYGKYIGETGVHQTAEHFKKAGYADTVLYPHAPINFEFPGRSDLDMRIAKQRSFSRAALEETTTAAVRAAASVASRFETPHLFEGEQRVFERILGDGCSRYLEFGVGGSTLIAIRNRLKVVSIDSDEAWVKAASEHPEISAAVSSGRAVIRHADIGPVIGWGNPKDRANINKWPNYVATAWDAWPSDEPGPDIVFVDGRFRIACCLSVILAIGPEGKRIQDLRVMLHDVSPDRPHYDPVFDFFDIIESVNTLRVMRIKPRTSNSRVLTVLLRSQFDQR